MISVRMRASRKGRCRKPVKLQSAGVNRSVQAPQIHISGAEGLYDETSTGRIVSEYLARAMGHPRGAPDKIVITIEKISRRPRKIKGLSVRTLKSSSPAESISDLGRLADAMGITRVAFKESLRLLRAGKTVRGACLLCAETGRRLDHDPDRGIRVSRLGISRDAEKVLSRQLGLCGIDNSTVREAVILASKVAAEKDIIAEICISDDPDYTTGYFSSRRFGYVRIPHIKKPGSRKGGRIFFLGKDADIDSAVDFLEETPALLDTCSACMGIFTIDEILDLHHR